VNRIYKLRLRSTVHCRTKCCSPRRQH